MKAPNGFMANSVDAGERKAINSELWHACAGPLVSLPPVGSLVVYFPQGHSEQVAASMQKQTDFVPSYPNLPSKMICMLHNVTLHADPETDEVYAQMTLQPVNKYEKEALLASEMALKLNKQPTEFFCKTLTASDTSTHGGFSVPRRAAEKIFPPLDFSMQPPAQEIVAKDLHDHSWTFRHIYRGQPKRHLLTTGWSVFVSTKRLYAGDSVLFIRNEKQQLLLGIRHAHRQQPALSSSVISSDSMHIGVLAAAAHAAANNSPFTIFYNPRASPSEFVVPFAKYQKALYTQVSPGMRFRMMFETEESGVRRYMGTVTGISDLDPVRWKGSQWRNLQIGWDESAAGERPSRVSIWDIEPVVTPFYICPPPFFRPKFPRHPGMPDDEFCTDNLYKRAMPWLGDEFGMKDTSNSMFPGLSLVQWMSMQQNNQFSAAQSGLHPSMLTSTALQNSMSADDPSKLLSFQASTVTASSPHFNNNNPENHVRHLSQPQMAWPQQPESQQLQQQQQQQLLQSTLNQQHQNNGQQLQPQPWPGHQSVQQPQNQFFPQQQKQQQQVQQQQPPQQIFQPSLNNNVVVSNYLSNQALQQQLHHSQLQQQQLPMGNAQTQQGLLSTKSSLQQTSLPQDLQQVEQKPNLLQRHNERTQLEQSSIQLLQQNVAQKTQQHTPLQPSLQQGFSEQQLQLQMLQKLQQQQLFSSSSTSVPPHMQQQQLFSPSSSSLPPHTQQQQSMQLQQIPMPQKQQHHCSNGFSTSPLVQTQRLPVTQSLSQHRLPTTIRAPSGLTDGDAPSCSTSPSTNNCQVSSSNLLNRSQQGLVMRNSAIDPASTSVQEMHTKSDILIRQELPNSRSLDQLTFRGIGTDQLEASSSGTSYCLDTGSMQQNFSLPKFCLDGDVQSHPQNNLSLTNIDGLVPDNLLTQRSDSQKDLQNLLSAYDGNPRDVETELSTAAISAQPFGVTDMQFKPGCSTDISINEAGVLNNGLWGNQAPRMRTYTKVQKRGSVGRTIDVTRYRGYDELRHDLARIFGIEGQLEDPQRTDWKLVYVDHENDILLVGDDPWEEFVSCVQSIKILSSAEVQQISLDGNLGLPIANQACSGTDSGNAWRV